MKKITSAEMKRRFYMVRPDAASENLPRFVRGRGVNVGRRTPDDQVPLRADHRFRSGLGSRYFSVIKRPNRPCPCYPQALVGSEQVPCLGRWFVLSVGKFF